MKSPSGNNSLGAEPDVELRTCGTYYTRPMSPPWSKPLDVDRLAETQAGIDFSVPLAELPRLRSRFASVEGSVHGHVDVAREAGIAMAELTMSGTARQGCQRWRGG